MARVMKLGGLLDGSLDGDGLRNVGFRGSNLTGDFEVLGIKN